MVWPSLSLAACRCRVGEHLLRLNGSSGATVANRLWRFPRAQVRTHRRETAELFASSTGIHCGNRLPIGGTGIELSVPIRGTVFLGRIKLALSAHTLTSVNNLAELLRVQGVARRLVPATTAVGDPTHDTGQDAPMPSHSCIRMCMSKGPSTSFSRRPGRFGYSYPEEVVTTLNSSPNFA